jgi:hypothetical protein
MKKLMLALFLTVPIQANALMCFIDAPDGQRYYRMVGRPTTYLSGKAATVKPCSKEGLRVEKSVAHAGCLSSAEAACDPTWGGVKLFLNPTVPESDNQNYYFRVTSGTDNNGQIYYRRLEVYDATKAAR